MAHKVGPALAAGNTVVGKPAPNTPLSGVRLFEHLEDARQQVGASPSLVNVVPGEGEAVGDPLLSDERREAISFTGSTAVGKHIAESTGMRELTLELGGNDPTIIWEDTDIEAAAERVVSGACSNAGQVCNSVERVIIPDSIASKVVDALVDAADALTVGDPFEEGTDVASMVDDDQFEKIVEIFEKTVDAGATVETGGNYGGDLGPRVFEPTVLSDVTPEMPAATAETFGPIVPVLTVSDFDEAIEQANNTAYGLEAGLFTQDIDRAKRAADEIDAGGVNINTVSGFRTDHMPYGGFKDSGVGKEGIKYACDHLSKTKLVGFHAGFGENA
jgi:lactaldehyde dehydrogenase